MKVLITGVSGSGGSYLAEYLVTHHSEHRIFGAYRAWNNRLNAFRCNTLKDVELYQCDLNDALRFEGIVARIQPDAIFHLASNADVRASWDRPIEVMQNNGVGAGSMFFEAVRQACPKARVLVCSTSEVYGQVDPNNVPITEECHLAPANPYAVSKLVQDMLGQVYARAYGMHIVRTRAFTYINPRRKNLFATAFALQVARVEAGLQKEVLHGNLDSVRTIIDVRDLMRAYWLTLEKCRSGEAYNIGGTTVMSVGQVLEFFKSIARCPIPSRVDSALVRPVDVTLQIPDCSKFKRETGWSEEFSAEDALRHLLDSCREEVRKEGA